MSRVSVSKVRGARRFAVLAALVTCLTLLGTAAPRAGEGGGGDIKPSAAKVFVGPLQGAPKSARIAVVTEETKFLVYVCSQDEKFNASTSRWLRGDLGDGNTFVAASPDGVKVSGTAAADGATGTLTDADGKVMKFTAKQVALCGNAGLYRATEKSEGQDLVAGWIVDPAGVVAGNVANRATGKSTPPPKGKGNNLGAIGQTGAAKVNSAKSPPAGVQGKSAKGRVTPELRAEILQDLVARSKARGGSPLQGVFVNLLRRLEAGQKPATDLEQQLFPVLNQIPRGERQKYLKNWDALPAATRNTILGASATQAAAAKPLAVGNLLALAKFLPQKAPVSPGKAGAPPSFKSIQIRELHAVDETNPEVLGSDEIFVIYTVALGQQIFDPKQTQVYGGLDTGEFKPFLAADATVFPPAGLNVSPTADVEITAGVFEDDSAGIQAVTDFLKAAAKAGVELAKILAKDKVGDAADLQQSINDFFDALAAALPTTQFLGSDRIIIRPNGQRVGANGQAKTQLTIQRFKNGERLYRYDLRDIRLF